MTRLAGLLGAKWVEDAIRERRESGAFWGNVDQERQKRIRRAVYRGEAVSDPRDSDLAVAWSRHIRANQTLRRAVRAGFVHGVVLIVLGAIAWVSGFGSPIVLAAGAFVLVNLAGLGIFAELIERRARRAEAANLRLSGSVS